MRYNYMVCGRRYVFGLRPYQWGTIGMWVLTWIIAALLVTSTVHAREDVLPNVELETDTPYNNEENQPEPDYITPPIQKNPGEYEYDAPPTRDNPLDGNKNRHGEMYEEDWVDDVGYPRQDRHGDFKKVIHRIRTILDVVEEFVDGG